MTVYLSMADAIDPTSMPAGQDIYAGYTGGRWPTYPTLAALFPGKRHLGFAVSAADWGDALDIETGDATIDQAAGWARNVWRPVNTVKPVLYINAGNIAPLAAAMAAAGWNRGDWHLMSAHYGHGLHLCARDTCGYPPDGTTTADATQWYAGGLFDLSTVPDTLFAPATEDPLTPQDITNITAAVLLAVRQEFQPGSELFDRTVQAAIQAIRETPQPAATVDPAQLTAAINTALNTYTARLAAALTTQP